MGYMALVDFADAELTHMFDMSQASSIILKILEAMLF